jgi:prohibitin 2
MISEIVQEKVSEERRELASVMVQGLDLTGLQIAEEYRAAIEQKQIAEQQQLRAQTEQQRLRAQTEVKLAEHEAQRYQTLNSSLDDQVLHRPFLDKWEGQTSVVAALPGAGGAGGHSVIVNGRR